jgi:sulfide dehydrogenase cytochrome subunit
MTLAAMIAAAVSFYSCEKDFEQTSTAPATPPVGPQFVNMNLPGRTLAANCFQCHGTNGYAGELKIATMSVSEITNKLNQYAASPANGDIMNVHAQAYTAAEVSLIADYFSRQ